MATETLFLHNEYKLYGWLTPEDRGCQSPLFFSCVLLLYGSFTPEAARSRKNMPLRCLPRPGCQKSYDHYGIYTQQNKLKANNLILPLFNTETCIFNFQIYL